MKQSPDNRPHFNAAAETWDANPRRVNLARQVAQSMKKQLPFQTDWNALEIGCGTGLLTCPVSSMIASLTALDTSEKMIDELNKKICNQQTSNIQSVVSDIFSFPHIPEQTKKYHLIFSSMTFHHIENVDGALQKLFSLLLPGGYLAIADLDEEDGYFHNDSNEKVHHGFRRNLFQKQLLQQGFTDISFSTAAKLTKTNRANIEKTYTVFLATARKSTEQ